MLESGVSQDATANLKDALRLFEVSKSFGRVEVLRDLTLDASASSFVAVVGPSGSGKTTLLRILAGLEEASKGSVSILGTSPAELRARGGIGIAFQDSALLPWRTVIQNAVLPFEVRGEHPDTQRVRHLLGLVGLGERQSALPSELSGGMRRRVSLVRALACKPSLLLLDEPFSSLDLVLRRRLSVALRDLWRTDQPTTVMVTHDIEDAVRLADRIVVLDGPPGVIVKDLPLSPAPEARTESQIRESADEIAQLLLRGVRSIWLED